MTADEALTQIEIRYHTPLTGVVRAELVNMRDREARLRAEVEALKIFRADVIVSFRAQERRAQKAEAEVRALRAAVDAARGINTCRGIRTL